MRLIFIILLVTWGLTSAFIIGPLGKSRNDGSTISRNFKLGKSFSRDDIHLSAPQLIAKRGYKVEVHRIFTQDGYILEAHRIPAPGRPVVFAFHGMFQSSRDLLMNDDHKALAYKLADAGYDVWLGNARGNFYSRRHTYLSPDTSAFWNYSVDEIIYYDVPASVDYVLTVTGQPRLNWVGFSLGSAVMLGLLSSRPEYNDKINLFFSLGTTAHVGGAKSPVMRVLAPLANLQDTIVTAVNHGEYLPQFLFPFMQRLFPIFCYPEAALNIVGLCSSFLFIIAGFNPSQASPATLPVMLGGTPSSVSVKMLSQWYQWINKGVFSYYDYGTYEKNMRYYKQSEPPVYDLSQVTAKTVNVWAENDWLSVPEDVHSVVKRLRNVVANMKVNLDSFNHLDFIYGKDADKLVYDPMLQMLQAYT